MAPIQPQVYHANGKVLLTAEYFVLDGAQALALPTRLGQNFLINTGTPDTLGWKSFDADGTCWLDVVLAIPSLKLRAENPTEQSSRLIQVLEKAFSISELPLTILDGITIQSRLEFSRHWGLGSSSTLVNFVAQLARIDPFELLNLTFGGSGYDLACAQAKGPIIYQNRQARSVVFQPGFRDQLYFVYLGKKQNSREGIQRYRALGEISSSTIDTVNELTTAFVDCQTLSNFEQLILEHENLVGSTLGLTRAQNLYFTDFWGQIKSLGAWGGDFVLATSNQGLSETKAYFQKSGFEIVLPYAELIG